VITKIYGGRGEREVKSRESALSHGENSVRTPKLNRTEKRRQDQICSFRRGDFKTMGYNTEKLSLVRFPVKMVSTAWKLSTTEERSKEQNCFGEGITRINGKKSKKLSWVRVSVKMMGLGIITSIILNYTYQVIRPVASFLGR
jgi:hypothetical protein